jgi:hypothetical protein
MDNNIVTLVIFSSEGREHLLMQMFPSFLANCNIQFAQIILAIDGQYSPTAVKVINPDTLIQQYERNGYITNITNALKMVSTPYFFWLEDDFLFNQPVPFEKMLAVLQDKSWGAVYLSRFAPIAQSRILKDYGDGLLLLDIGFSVSPTMCNTEVIKKALAALYESEKSIDTRRVGFEPFIDQCMVADNLKYAVIDPGTISHVNHIGELESTAREYHMVNSVNAEHSDIDKFYLSGFGKEGKITFYNKLAMFLKLIYSTAVLSIKLFVNRPAYDFAFRVYLAFLRGFKY